MNLKCIDNKGCGILFKKGKVYKARSSRDGDTGSYLVESEDHGKEKYVQLDDTRLTRWGTWRKTKAMTEEQKMEKALLKAVNKV